MSRASSTAAPAPVLSGSTAGRCSYRGSLAHHLFDTLYHTVAFEEDATLVTADACYYNKASVLGKIMLLGHFSRE
ncbi:MAG: hypothetical protein ACREWE_03925 [Gammaproteobacteria bacterium]